MGSLFPAKTWSAYNLVPSALAFQAIYRFTFSRQNLANNQSREGFVSISREMSGY